MVMAEEWAAAEATNKVIMGEASRRVTLRRGEASHAGIWGCEKRPSISVMASSLAAIEDYFRHPEREREKVHGRVGVTLQALFLTWILAHLAGQLAPLQDEQL